MKLKGIAVQEKMVALQASVKESVSDEFDAYVEYARAESGVDNLSKREVLALMVEQFMSEDRSFQSWKRQQEKKKKAESRGSDSSLPSHGGGSFQTGTPSL